jgi:DNA polymerase III alpha subunit
MNQDFIHLHCHSSFSLKDGVGSPEKRVDWAVKNKKSACALSDHGNISSWMSLYSACEKNNIKPIMGCEFYFNRYADELEKSLLEDDSENIQIRKKLKYFNSHITMFAKNETGYYNMIKIHNDAWLNRFYRFPITSPTTIQKNHDGIICLSGCSGSEANKIISKKQYLLSEKRKTDILEEVENKSFIIQQLYKDKNIDRAIKNDDFNDSDLDYFNSHTMFSPQEYQQFAKDLIEKEDLNFINQADKKVEEIIDWWYNLFGQDFYIEIMVIDHTPQIHINQELIKIAQKKNIPLVITNDAHYIEKSGAKIQEFQMLNDQDKTFKELQAQESNETDENSKKIWTIKSEQLYYKTVEELKDTWEKLHKSEIFTEKVFYEAIKNSVVIADKIENFKIDKSIKLPKLSDDSKDVLWSKIENGLKNKNLDNEKYRKQAEYEFDIICKKDFVDYFLITQEMIVWAKRKFGKYSVGPGRGCFTPDTEVLMEDKSLKKIKDICVGDRIISSYGQSRKVINKFEYDVHEEMNEVVLSNGDNIKCTKDHKILCIPKNKEKDIKNAIWKESKDLVCGDFLIKL